MATTIKIKNSVTATTTPTSLVQGEVAINVTDKKVWVGNAATTPVLLVNGGPDGVFTSITDSGNLTFTGTGNRILGDFSNATLSSRVAFQSSTTNGNTALSAFPNGTAVASNFTLYNNSDPTNAGTAQIAVNASEARFSSTISGTGTYLPLTMFTGGSEKLRIDTSGNVGIGTTSPTKLLTVFKTQNAETSILVRNESTDTAGKAIIRFGNSNSDDVGSIGALSSGFTPSGALEADGFYVDSGRQSLNLSASNSGIIKFFGTGNERMRIDNSGTLFIGATSSPSGTQRLVLTANGSAGIEPMLFNELRSSAATENYVRFYRNGSQVGAITNTLSATAYVTSSDYRLKENIVPMTGALAKVAQLNPVTYTWKSTGETSQGFIAHELQAVVPDCVTGEKDAVDKDGKPKYQGVDTSFLVATLTAAIQEQQALIENLTTRLNALEGN